MSTVTESNKLEMSDVILVIKRLTEILSEEIDMLKNMKIMKINTFQEEKLKLLSVMEHFKKTLQDNPDILNSISPDTKKELIEANSKFEKLVAEDGKQLLKVKKVHSIFMENIRKIVNEHRKKNSVYNEQGILGESKKKILMATPFKLNSSI